MVIGISLRALRLLKMDGANKMVDKIPVSVYVLTFNNCRTIERCLKSLHWAEELVIVDSGSTDGTYEICQRYTSKFYRSVLYGGSNQ